ncbi:glycosyltransferase [Paenibacillus sp. LMG 31459]|uniref:Glycosyltransferase n=1 Tax=Paenibacillus phytohabitans TaxID=2654978 RepID=A0ABX1YC25_9BACL|nr:glycosyltransferase [Paenibacillus phytohabitans]NOU78512.1 glycosyltransferase [Paenibacillus phytohabitans]
MNKKTKHRIRTTGKTIRLHPRSRKLIAHTVIRALKNININQQNVSANLPQPARAVEFKKLRVLLVSAMPEEELWQTEQLIADQFRLLTKEVVAIKAFQSFSTALVQLNPDLLLVVGGDTDFSDNDLEVIRRATLQKAIWITDSSGTSSSTGRLAALFNYVFTQNMYHIPFYQHSGSSSVMYLPFAADRNLFSPKYVDEACRCDVLLLGDALPAGIAYLHELSPLLSGCKLYAAGKGWEEYPGITPVSPGTELQDYYNGAEIIIHWGQPPLRAFQIASCGAVQLAEDHSNLYAYMNPGEDIITFHTGQELNEKLSYYRNHPESARAVATRALWKSTYDYSFMQMAAKLLHTVFNS